jgi:hypothetical protein
MLLQILLLFWTSRVLSRPSFGRHVLVQPPAAERLEFVDRSGM